MLKILIIDDDEFDRLAIVRSMKKSNVDAEVVQAATASDGLRLAKNNEFDVILLDYSLPDQNGLDLLISLRENEISDTAIVMVSQKEDDELTEQAIDAGAQDFVLKEEINPHRLIRAIRQAQHRYAMERTLRTTNNILKNIAERDTLTGLANRHTFEHTLKTAVTRAERGKNHLAVLFLDLDKFKNINDTLGHDVGDVLLTEVAARLNTVVRESDLLARLGGDEFVVLAQDMEQDKQAVILASRLIESLKEPILLGATKIHITTSIGIAVLGVCAQTATDLMKYADIAMYRAKKEGINQSHFYSEELHKIVNERIKLESELQYAFDNNQLSIYYQPQFYAKDGLMGGIEALLRWHHPQRGILLPGEFLPIADELGMMVDIDSWVLRTACKQVMKWKSYLPGHQPILSMSVNLTALQLEGEGFIKTVEKAIADNKIEPGCLELEITENSIVGNLREVAQALIGLADKGVSISLDDFGTGFSSFEHLKMFPVRALKIDQTFISAIGQNEKTERLLIAIMNFAKSLELTIIAEGVETVQQATFCKEHGCDLLQGFYYAKPLPTTEFEQRFFEKENNDARQ